MHPKLLDRAIVPDFKIFTGELLAAADGPRKVISCTASSSVVDLHGDEITAACVADMAQQALSKGMTIFLNHSYQIPEDTFGTTVAADTKMGSDGVALMDLRIEVDETNPRANQTYASIMGDPATGRKGLRMGVSIGAQVTEWEFRDAKKEWDGGIRIKGVDLLEASIVGIPANQRSWVHNAVKSLRKSASLPPLTEDDDALEDATVEDAIIQDSAGTGEEMVGIEVPADGTEATLTAGESDPEVTLATDQIEALLGIAEVPPTELVASADTTDEPVASAPDAGDSRGDADAVVTDQAVEDIVATAANLTVSDSDRPVLTVVLATLEQAASELRATRSMLTSVQAERDGLIAERDKAVSDLAEASQIIEIIAKLPLGRKTRFIEPVSSFRQRFSAIYDEDFLRLIDERQET